MRKIIIKLPDKRVKKFRLQKYGYKSRRYLKASSLINALEKGFLRKELREKTAIVVKQWCSTGFMPNNESLASSDHNYLLMCSYAFLEDSLSATIRKRGNKYIESR